VASQEAIKQLGTDGGRIFNANSAHPFQHPGTVTDLIEMVEMNVLGFACVVAFGLTPTHRRDARGPLGVAALFVAGSPTTRPRPRARVAEAFSLPEQAGGSTVMLTGDDLVDCILTYARQGNITIRAEAERLNRYAGNLLHMTHLEGTARAGGSAYPGERHRL
jgi:hypothetical protein